MKQLLLLIFALNVMVVCFGKSSYILNDGNEIPAIALGTSLGHSIDGRRRMLNESMPIARAVQWALEAGYRHIDTASIYRVEGEVGVGVRNFLTNSEMNRSDLFINTKLWNDAHEKDEVIPALKKSLAKLQMDYVDLYLMHYPMAFKANGSISQTDYLTTWQGIEDAKKMNLTRSIGVCNFNLTQMKRLWNNSVTKPSVLQIKVNPTSTQEELVKWCKDHDVVVMASGPFGFILSNLTYIPPPKANDPFLQSLAKRYNKNIPQILLRYLLDQNMVVVPRSTIKKYIEDYINVQDFNLTPLEIKLMSEFNSNLTLRIPDKWYDHPHFPFQKNSEMEKIYNNTLHENNQTLMS